MLQALRGARRGAVVVAADAASSLLRRAVSGLVDGVRLIYAAARIYFYFRCCFVPGERVETACAGVKGLRGWVGGRVSGLAGGRRG